jgi:oligoendopeptidase F
MVENELIWDLSQLVENTDFDTVQKQLDYMASEAEAIREKYYGRISNLDAKGLLELLQSKDAYYLKYEGVQLYCELMYYANSTDKIAKQLNDASRTASVKVGQSLAFIDIELGNLLVKNPSLISDLTLAEYRHYLEKLLRKAPHMLSEVEERLVLAKDKNGITAWELLQGEWLSTRMFDVEIEGKKKTLPYGEIIGLYESPNRDLRKQADQTLYENLGKDEIIWASAIRSICEDHVQMCKQRKYPTAMSQSLMANDVDQETIDSVMNTIKKNVGLYQRYLGLKAKLIGLNKLASYDIAAPLPTAPKTEYNCNEARKEIEEAYRGFDREIGLWIAEMYDKRHIDGKVRKGKTAGAFCASWQDSKSAYILQSFNNKMGDVYTQAHELGHAIHAYLGARAQRPSNFGTGSCMAETGSIFGELLLTERLLSEAKTKEEKQAILARILDEFGIAAFKVSARVFFEQSMYDAIERGKYLDGETVAKLWVTARDQIYGDAVEWLEVTKYDWTKTPHYYFANYRFYNYPYVYAQLFVFALYQLYKEQGQSFIPKLKKLLATRGSKSPRELAAELGFNIAQEAFWQKGMNQAEKFVNMLEETLRE